jgi:aminoglycoside phosphotransferase (APT) family kinase protein
VADTTTTGIDEGRVTDWLAAHEPALRPPVSFERIAGGHSNLTYRVGDAAGGRWVLRRPPLGSLLPSAHDMAREHRVIAALGPTPVPVPAVVGLCVDEAVNGVPFYVMAFVDGVVLRDSAAAHQIDEEARGAVADSMVDVLAALHDVDPDAVGLGDLARREAFVERTLRRWRKQWEGYQTRVLPVVEEVATRLERRIPAAGPARIVHGDYGLHNVLLAADTGAVRAVLDWEICTLGEPLADLGWLLVTWTEPGDRFSPLPDPATLAPGFPGRKELIERYGRRSGRDLSDLDFYVALGLWKLAVVLEGVYSRYAGGAYGESDGAWRRFEALVPQIAEAALDATARAGR